MILLYSLTLPFPFTPPQTHSLHIWTSGKNFMIWGFFIFFGGGELKQSKVKKPLWKSIALVFINQACNFWKGVSHQSITEHVASNVIKVQLKPFLLITQTKEKLAHDQISNGHRNNCNLCSQFLLMLNIFFADNLTELSLISLSFLTNIYQE